MNRLQQHFSTVLRSREQMLEEIRSNPGQFRLFQSWKESEQENFLEICTGAKGMRILSDAFFKEVMSPEYDKGRLESFLGTVLGKKVKIVQVLPNDNTRIADEVALLVTDIVVELEDGSLANIEVQKIPYKFPAGRCACYSSDLMLRQYKRVRDRSKNSTFSYQNIKNVYLIVLYEKSPKELKKRAEGYIHHSKQVFDSGLKLDMLQEYVLISLDKFMETMQNKTIKTLTDAWLTFLGCDEPDRIMELIEKFPEFEAMYRTLYQMCLNTERMMSMFSEELHELDRNTIKYMIEEQQEELDALLAKVADNEMKLVDQEVKLADQEVKLADQEVKLASQEVSLAEKDSKIAELEAELAKLRQKE